MEMRLDMKHTGVLMFDLQKGEADETHTHDHFQLSVPLSGDLLTFHNHRTQKLEHNQSLLVPPDDIHQHEAQQDRKEIMLISFNEEIMKKAYKTHTGEDLHTIDFSPVQKNSQALLKEAKSIFQTASFDGVDAAMNLEEAFTSVILDQMSGSHSEIWHACKKEHAYGSAPFIKEVKNLIEDCYDENLTLESMAHHLNISKYHLHRIFNQSVGITPMAYLHKTRLEKATQILLSGSYDITNVAFMVGYQSISTFNRSFKKMYGKTPSQFVKEHRI
ncbi:AraC family transcriptional regulator [Pontibacillus marinus]|uniref:AraC family transcriptional regulator n=1 Tax=Pontibacillus marinus BH030004 = DSM 16465 TaxID=1385511 RepID=A0A0A5GF74_9BACI|nr:AraC family transcriptional regulator [Pontibacillus marinus]KGX89863.1 AraC family transcriptional regulator [Pontibacillus marinus BH030004 = DSM 16465]